MKQVVITADSAADLPKETAEKYGIEIMPMYVVFGGEAKKDNVEISAHEIFDYVESCQRYDIFILYYESIFTYKGKVNHII